MSFLFVCFCFVCKREASFFSAKSQADNDFLVLTDIGKISNRFFCNKYIFDGFFCHYNGMPQRELCGLLRQPPWKIVKVITCSYRN